MHTNMKYQVNTWGPEMGVLGCSVLVIGNVHDSRSIVQQNGRWAGIRITEHCLERLGRVASYRIGTILIHKDIM